MRKKKSYSLIVYSTLLLAISFIAQNFNSEVAKAAIYVADTDTEANIFDYIENRRRAERENMLDEDQKKLIEDAYKMRERLRNPLDPTKNVPIALEGDDMTYNQETGDVEVIGNVQLTTLDSRRLNTDKLNGNIDDSTAEIEGEAKLIQLTPDQLRVVLTGYKTQYDYNRGIGKMEDPKGKVGSKYIKAKRVELYPDVVIIYNGYITKCGAETPDFRLAADRIEVYPDGRMISYNVKYYIKDTVVYQSAKEITDPNASSMGHLPKAGYSSDDGFWISDDYTVHPLDRVSVDFYGRYMTRKKLKGSMEAVWNTKAAGTFKVYWGQYEDSKSNWIRKDPTIRYDYSSRIAKSPFYVSAAYEGGYWHQENTHSSHNYYSLSLTTAPYIWANWCLTPTVDYSVTKESYNDTTVNGFGYSLTLFKEFDRKWAYFGKYRYDKANSKNTAFNFDNDSFSRKFITGISYMMTQKDRFVASYKFDLDSYKLDTVDCYWFHDLHCAEFVLRYRPLSNNYSFVLQFTPW